MKQTDTSQFYAIKLIHSANINGKEISLLERLKECEQIVTMEKMEKVGYRFAFKMPYFPRGDLFCYIAEKGALSETFFLKCVLSILEGVCALHEIQHAHRDIKPENILLNEEGKGPVACLTDFESVEEEGKISYGFVGTSGYAAPEVFICQRVTSKSDLWSFACVMYTMLTGHPMCDLTPHPLLICQNQVRMIKQNACFNKIRS